MYYHAKVVFAELGEEEYYHYWINYTKEELFTDVLGPFLRGQIIQCHSNDQVTLINLGSARYLNIFRTERVLDDSQAEQFEKGQSVGEKECTEEILGEIRFDKATEHAKSLLEKLMLPPKKQMFVIIKLNDELLDSAYEGVIRPLGEEFGYHVVRIDEIENSNIITDQVLELIAESELVLADLTGSRPNCYFETGVALATGRELILTIKKGENPHFDLSVNRFIQWKTEGELRTKLRKRLEAISARRKIK